LRIKSLQVHGFKSFVDRTVFRFEDGMTAVVGPNGCGKSNVVDAIRWVMGEQSPRRLRGKGMDDVIFVGSETRPPIGMAEVTLTFDNGDGRAPAAFSVYNEIQIARRLYRSGESEYLINKTTCRLREVQDFFRDTGFGVRGYTIVEQGRVAEIVSARPEDRRILIEEAAGISKYKARRREAESKIRSTEQNLHRVTDVLGEIKRQISSLERQARKAARYKRLRETQRVLELSLAADERSELSSTAQAARASFSRSRDAVTGLETQLAERELELEHRRIALTESEKVLSGAAERLYGVRSDIKQLEGQVELGRRECESLDASNEGRRSEIEHLREQIRSAERELADVEAELRRAEESAVGEEESLAAAERDAREAAEELRARERERDAANEALVEILTATARAEDRTAVVAERRAELDLRLRSADRQLEVNQSEAAVASSDRTRLEEGLRNLLGERERVQEQLRRSIRSHATKTEEERETVEQLRLLRETWEARKARLASLSEVIESRQDVCQAARHLLGREPETVRRLGLRGLVRELLEVDPKAETAVEAVLADRAEAVVAHTTEGAVEALSALHQAGVGRGVFVVEPERESVRGVVPLGEPLLGRVRVREGFEGVARALLGDVYLVAKLSEAIERYGGLQLPATFVTIEGDVLSPDGVLRGGGESAASGMLGRVREVRELEREVASLSEQVEAAESRYQRAEGALTAAGEQLDNLRNRQHTAVLAVASHEKDLERSAERVKALGEVQEGRVAERSELLAESETLAEEYERIQRLLEGARGEKAVRQREVDAVGLRISAAGRDVTRLESRLTELRIAQASRVETRSQLEDRAERARGSQDETGEWIRRREREIQEAVERREVLVGQMTEAEASLALKLREEEEARVAGDQLRDRYELEAEGVRGIEDAARGLRGQLQIGREEASAAEMAAKEAELRLQHQSEAIRDKWGIDIATWTPPALDEEAISEVRGDDGSRLDELLGAEQDDDLLDASGGSGGALRDARRNAELARAPRRERELELGKVRQGLQSLGDVNVGAIEEHEELAERFRFLSEQKEDLDTTIRSLREAIARINRTSRRRFRETFEAVSERFSQNFPRLFGGGRARLMLADAEDVLEAGVDIMAMPPGKRLQNVNLLSGGEKTLTALALLVAVFQVRPSPFFLLDEVDAALDDANVGRFNQLIREMAAESQFLVITHNKRTIEEADILYGVTMEQKGVSKLVSVELH